MTRHPSGPPLANYLPPRYRVDRVLSQGGAGATFEAFDSSLHEAQAVVKVQRLADEDALPEAEARFRGFCSALASIPSDLIAVPYTFGTFTCERGAFGYTTRAFVSGTPLSGLALPLGEEALLRVALQVCQGLDAVHGAGLAHGDLKPENVIVRRAQAGRIDEMSRCVLIDFSYRGASDARALGDVTLQYVAPEMLEGRAPDPRTDLYALGVMLYRLASGRFPFEGGSAPEVMQRQRAREFVPLSTFCPDIARGLCRAVERLLEPNPAHRPENVQAFLALLGELGAPAREARASRQGAFLGREREIEECLDALDLARPSSGTSSVGISGPRGVGVTAFLRELQDRLEARGVTVLTATPRAAGGRTFQEQLRDAVRAIARRSPLSGTDVLAAGDTSTDLLDDLFVAAQERRVVLFVDDAHLADPAEAAFLERLILQDKASIEGMAGRCGRCQVVLGEIGGVAGAPTHFIARRVTLGGLTVEETAALLARSETLSRLHAARVHAATGGHPKAICAVLDRVAAAGAAAPEAALDAALEAAVTATDADAEEALAAIRSAPHGEALLALLLWGGDLPVERWRALLALCGGSGEEPPVEVTVRSGRTFVRSRHAHLGLHLASVLAEPLLARLAEALVAATWEDWRSQDPEPLVPLLRMLGRFGRVPARCRWRLCRAMILLLERGRFADLESIATALAARPGAPWWVGLFREAAWSGSRGPRDAPREATDVDVSQRVPFFREWIRARALLRARHRQEALKILDALAAVERPWARSVALALAEDRALAAAEVAPAEHVLRLRRQMLRRVGRWLPLARRRRGGRVEASMRVRLRACRKVARYLRVRAREHMGGGRNDRAITACRRERLLNRASGSLLREAACLNNEGLLLIHSHKDGAAVTVLERCIRLRERLDDEHGLLVGLTNLAVALSANGTLGSAAAALNRARVIATRNGLGRQRTAALVNLGVTYHRRGQLRDARRVLRQASRIASEEVDQDAHAQALLSTASVAVDRLSPSAAEGYASRLSELRKAVPALPAWLNGDLIRAELAHRSRDWAHLHTLVARLRTQCPGRPELEVYEARIASEAGNKMPRRPLAAEHGLPVASRLRLALLRRGNRSISSHSLARVVAFARRRASAREAVEWILAYLGRSERDPDVALDVGFKTLSSFELREGHDDLQIELRAALAAILRKRGRDAEAWRLIEDALFRFRRLERRLRRWPRGVHLLLHLQERIQRALAGSARARSAAGQEISAGLCAQAFDVLLAHRGQNAAAAHSTALARLGAVVARRPECDAFIDEILDVALGATGAERAVLVTGTAASRDVRRTRFAEGKSGDAAGLEMSWAVVTQVLASGEASVFGDALTAEELASHRSIALLKLRSLACVPLRAAGQILGALYLDHQGIAGLFTQDSLGFLELLAGLVGMTLHAHRVEEQAGAARRELQETHRHILRAERNRVAGEIAGGLVHDLKNVLAAISGRAQLLRRATQDSHVLRSVDAVEKAAGAGIGLVQRLQECARDHSSQGEEEVDLAAVAHEALELLSPRLHKNSVRADVEAAPGSIVWGVPGEYREMFLNLFLNACDAMPEGGVLTVRVNEDAPTGQIEATVRDTGVGMSAETKARVFEPFFTTKGSRGTGLGLVVVRTVIVRHGGSIAVESEAGKGTLFRIRLPKSDLSQP